MRDYGWKDRGVVTTPIFSSPPEAVVSATEFDSAVILETVEIISTGRENGYKTVKVRCLHVGKIQSLVSEAYVEALKLIRNHIGLGDDYKVNDLSVVYGFVEYISTDEAEKTQYLEQRKLEILEERTIKAQELKPKYLSLLIAIQNDEEFSFTANRGVVYNNAKIGELHLDFLGVSDEVGELMFGDDLEQVRYFIDEYFIKKMISLKNDDSICGCCVYSEGQNLIVRLSKR